jgi:hypothetical protein
MSQPLRIPRRQRGEACTYRARPLDRARYWFRLKNGNVALVMYDKHDTAYPLVIDPRYLVPPPGDEPPPLPDWAH